LQCRDSGRRVREENSPARSCSVTATKGVSPPVEMAAGRRLGPTSSHAAELCLELSLNSLGKYFIFLTLAFSLSYSSCVLPQGKFPGFTL
jgi:hypothetical protein